MEPKAFFSRLESLAERDSSVVATLRRSLAFDPGAFPAAFPIIEPTVSGLSERKRRLYYLAAGLWALGQRRASGPPLGLPRALHRVGSGHDSGSVGLRFTALLDSDEDELPHRLRQAVGLVTADQIALDWPQLLIDLIGWSSDSRYVQRRWARAYWSHGADPESASAHASPTEADSPN
jgi:CRISPR system Cascade subunit CasB